MKGLIGVLGGMGPAATVDLFNKFVTFTAAQRDQEHIPLIISSIPDIPDRTDALMHNGLSPLPVMRDYMHKLEDAGAECIVIPCNTAHYWWYLRLQYQESLPANSFQHEMWRSE